MSKLEILFKNPFQIYNEMGIVAAVGVFLTSLILMLLMYANISKDWGKRIKPTLVAFFCTMAAFLSLPIVIIFCLVLTVENIDRLRMSKKELDKKIKGRKR